MTSGLNIIINSRGMEHKPIKIRFSIDPSVFIFRAKDPVWGNV